MKNEGAPYSPDCNLSTCGSTQADIEMIEQVPPLQPQDKKRVKLERYTILETLGHGAFAKVKRAIDIETGQQVAIKLTYSKDEA
jgi:serine/threonine protein kinase